MECIVIENDNVQAGLLINHINENETTKLLGIYTDVENGITEIRTHTPDLIFLNLKDVDMSQLEYLMKLNLVKSPKVIVTTTKKDLALRAFSLGAFDYLLKPISCFQFLKVVNRVLGQLILPSGIKKDFLFLKSGKVKIKIMFDDILWIQSDHEYLIVYTKIGKYMIYSSMQNLLERLTENFIRVHRSYIVALSKIEKISNDIIIIDQHHIKISKSYKSAFNSKLEL